MNFSSGNDVSDFYEVARTPTSSNTMAQYGFDAFGILSADQPCEWASVMTAGESSAIAPLTIAAIEPDSFVCRRREPDQTQK